MRARKLLFPLCAPAAFAVCACDRPNSSQAQNDQAFIRFFLEPHESPLLRSSAGAAEETLTTRPLVGIRPQTMRRSKTPGSLRVFVVGGSTAQGYDQNKNDPLLSSGLSKLLSGREIEVINCGRSSFDSSRDLMAIRNLMEFEPDLFVLMSVVNEGAIQPLPAWSHRLWLVMQDNRLLRALALELLHSLQRIREAIPPLPDDNVARFDSNLRSIIASAGKVPVVLCAMPINLKDMPPENNVPLEDRDFLAAWRLFESRRWEDASRSFAAYVAAHPDVPMARFFLGKCLESTGRKPEALVQYRRIYSDSRPVLALNSTLRNLAHQSGSPMADLEGAFSSVSRHGLVGRDLIEDDVHWWRGVDPLVTATILRAIWNERSRPRISMFAGKRGWDERWLKRYETQARRRAMKPEPEDFKAWFSFRGRAWTLLSCLDSFFSERVLALIDAIDASNHDLASNAYAMKAWMKHEIRYNTYESSSNLDEWWPGFLAHIGEHHRRAGRQRLAQEYFSMALDAGTPHAMRVRLAKAISHMAEGRTDLAASEVAQAGDWRSDPVGRALVDGYGLPTLAMKAPSPPSVPFTTGAGKASELATQWQRISLAHDKEAPKHPPTAARADVPLADIRAALDSFSGGHVQESEAIVSRILNKDPANWTGLLLRGSIFMQTKRLDQALQDFDKIIQQKPAYPKVLADALSHRGMTLELMGRRSEAAEDYIRCLKAAPPGWARRASIEVLLSGARGSQTQKAQPR